MTAVVERGGGRGPAELRPTTIQPGFVPTATGSVLISCGGLMTLNCAEPIEARHGIPVVTSTQSAFWKALRLAGDNGQIKGYGRMLAQSEPVPA